MTTRTVLAEEGERTMSNKKRNNETNDEMVWELESTLEPGMLRFMAHVIESGLNIGLRTDEDFIRHFTPMDIMMGLSERPDLRANILVPTTGVRAKIASKKSAEAAGNDLQIALDEGETDATLIVSLFHPDDRVRYLDKARLWNYITEPKFWMYKREQRAEHDNAKSHVAFIIDHAIEERLVTHREIIEGITVSNLVKHLPTTEIQAILEGVLSNAHANKPFGEQELLEAVPSKQLVEHLPLTMIWDQVINPQVAARNGLVTGPATESFSASTSNGRNDSSSWNKKDNKDNKSDESSSDDDKVYYAA
jgi:hypothetical protein